MIVGLLLSAIGFGVVFAWTRSLFPAIVAHAIFDIPMTLSWQVLLVGAFVVGAIFIWRRGLAISKLIFSTGSGFAYGTLAVLGAGYVMAAARVRSMGYIAVGLLVLAVAPEAADRRRNQITAKASISE
jgi:hypothetical protein